MALLICKASSRSSTCSREASLGLDTAAWDDAVVGAGAPGSCALTDIESITKNAMAATFDLIVSSNGQNLFRAVDGAASQVGCRSAEFFFDAQQLVVFGDTVS